MARTRRTPQLAKFPRLREIREQTLGWDVVELVSKLPGNRPSIASIYRLEQGQPLRVSNVRRVFELVNEAVGQKLDPHQEIVPTELHYQDHEVTAGADFRVP